MSENLDFYDEYDDIDDEEFETESFESRLERYGLTANELRKSYSDFTEWYQKMLDRIKPENSHKTVACTALLRYIDRNGADDDIIGLWCVYMSENSDFIFDTDSENDMQYKLYNYMELKNDIEGFFYRIKNEDRLRKEFSDLIEKISLSNDFSEGSDMKHLYHVFSIDIGLDGECLEDNLNYISGLVNCSKELSRISPLVYYRMFTLYRTKFLESRDYEPNFKEVLRYYAHKITKDNGKNINTIYEHMQIYTLVCQCLDESTYNKYFCDVGFSVMSNIPECDLIKWKDFPEFTRPLKNELEYNYFSCFPGGYSENPVFVGADVHPDDMDNFEYFDEEKPKPIRILDKIRPYISGRPDIADRYTQLLKTGETKKCMPLVLDVLNNSGVDAKFIDPDIMDVVNAVIMQEIMSFIDDRIKKSMIGVMQKF